MNKIKNLYCKMVTFFFHEEKKSVVVKVNPSAKEEIHLLQLRCEFEEQCG